MTRKEGIRVWLFGGCASAVAGLGLMGGVDGIIVGAALWCVFSAMEALKS